MTTLTPRLFLIACFVMLACVALAAVGAGTWLIGSNLPDEVGVEARDVVSSMAAASPSCWWR